MLCRPYIPFIEKSILHPRNSFYRKNLPFFKFLRCHLSGIHTQPIRPGLFIGRKKLLILFSQHLLHPLQEFLRQIGHRLLLSTSRAAVQPAVRFPSRSIHIRKIIHENSSKEKKKDRKCSLRPHFRSFLYFKICFGVYAYSSAAASSSAAVCSYFSRMIF